MAQSFSVHPSRLPSTSESALRDEVRMHTGSDEETASVLRSIARLGPDASIDRYEVTPVKQRPRGPAAQIAWSVRAVRP